jgi:hypothetical protein
MLISFGLGSCSELRLPGLRAPSLACPIRNSGRRTIRVRSFGAAPRAGPKGHSDTARRRTSGRRIDGESDQLCAERARHPSLTCSGMSGLEPTQLW